MVAASADGCFGAQSLAHEGAQDMPRAASTQVPPPCVMQIISRLFRLSRAVFLPRPVVVSSVGITDGNMNIIDSAHKWLDKALRLVAPLLHQHYGGGLIDETDGASSGQQCVSVMADIHLSLCTVLSRMGGGEAATHGGAGGEQARSPLSNQSQSVKTDKCSICKSQTDLSHACFDSFHLVLFRFLNGWLCWYGMAWELR